MGKTKLDDTYIFKINIKNLILLMWLLVSKSHFLEFWLLLSRGRSFLQFVTTNCLRKLQKILTKIANLKIQMLVFFFFFFFFLFCYRFLFLFFFQLDVFMCFFLFVFFFRSEIKCICHNNCLKDFKMTLLTNKC